VNKEVSAGLWKAWDQCLDLYIHICLLNRNWLDAKVISPEESAQVRGIAGDLSRIANKLEELSCWKETQGPPELCQNLSEYDLKVRC
jgi:hypothetical protein